MQPVQVPTYILTTDAEFCEDLMHLASNSPRAARAFPVNPFAHPQLEISVNSACGCTGSCPLCRGVVTKKSRGPSPGSPNFLQRFFLPARIPMHSAFAPTLRLLVKDYR